jgi:hypothetical protein
MEIPDPDGQDAVGVLPLLQELSGRRDLYLVLEGWPRLARAADGWPVDLLYGALEGATVGADGLGYLAKFVRSAIPAEPPPKVVDALAGLVRRILAAGVTAGRAPHLRDIAGRLPPARVLSLPLPEGPEGASPFLRSLLSADGARRLVPLPNSLGLHGQAAPTAAEATAFLEALREDHNSEPASPRSKIALSVLSACPPGILPEVLDRCQRLRLFHGHEVRDGTMQERALSVTDLREARANDTLFTDNPPSLADALSLATGASVLLAPRDVAALVGPQLGPCSAAACASLLSRWAGADLCVPVSRAPLLEALSSHSAAIAESVSENRQAVRLLLHGRAARLRSTEPLLYDRHGTRLWGRLVRATLGLDDQWRLIDPTLAARVPPHRAMEYSLQEVGPRTAEDELRRLGPELLAQIQFDLTPQDAAESLRCIQDADVLRALPIHEDVAASGSLRRIGPGCYWEGGVDLPAGLPAPPVLLRRSANVAERAIQDTLARPISHADAIRILLNQPESQRYWRPILDSFYSLGRAAPQDVLGALRSASWLPGPSGPVAPRSVLHLPGLVDVLASMPLSLLQGLVPSSRLLEAREHQGLQSLTDHRLVPSQEEALGLLGEALAEDSRYHVGQFATFLTDDAQGHSDLNSFLQAFAGVPDDVMAAYPLVAAVDRTIGRGLCVRVFLDRLKKPLPQDRLLQILDFLCRRHEQDGPREHIERVYLRYLGMLEGPEKRTFPDGLRLLSRAGTWRLPTLLCVGSDAISPEWRIDERQLGLLRPTPGTRQATVPAPSSQGVPALPQGDALQRELKGSVERLSAYFAEWERARPHLRPAIGGFLAALGDGPGSALRQMAERFLRPACELEDLRERMQQFRIKGESPPTQFDIRRVLVEVIDAPMVRVTNLCGGQVEAPLVQSVESLLLPFGDGNFVNGQGSEEGRTVQVTRLRLRRVDPAALADRLGEMLRKATREVLIHFYWLFPERDVFAPLIHADSQQLRAAQNLILDNAPLYLGQLGVSDRGALADAIRRMHLARNLAAQEEVAGDHLEPGAQAPPSLAPDRKRQARDKLKEQLREPGTQSAILAAIRRKVSRDFAYVPESVPFEILQNADDATVESFDQGRDGFGVWAGPGRVAFLHEGRAINQPPVGQPHDPLLGHERDLEKMLVLSSSDKPASEQGLTGKFGLGFKSVFLVCDEPLARSGGLGFRVLGGIYPEGLTAGEVRALEERFAQVAGRSLVERNGTILELPLRDGQPASFLDRFLDLLPVALAFTRRIRRCAVRVHREQEVRCGEPVPVPGVTGVAVGLLDGSRLFARQRVLVFDLGERRRLLIGVNPDGLCRLHDDVPTVWVTAPTRIECRVGFALNAPFDLDVGRTQLQREEDHHHALADELGAGLGRCLVALYEAPWEGVRQALGLRAELTREQFWASVWARFGSEFHARRRESDDLALRLLQRALYGQEGVRRLYTERSALPTGLPGDRFGGLTFLGNVKNYLTGCLDEDPGLLSRVGQWPVLRRRVGSGELISRSGVWEPLVNLLPAGAHRADPIDLARVMEWKLEADSLVMPDRATSFGALITKKFVDSLEGQEGRRLRQALRTAKFVHAGRGDALPVRLLVPGGAGIEEEEKRREAFAPPDRRLAPEYRGPALAFFLACRDRMSATADEMAEWFRAATGDARRAALEYLECGELAWQIAQRLREATTPNDWWRTALADDDLGDTARVLVGLASGGEVRSASMPTRPTPTIESIRLWWEANRVDLRERHLQWTYPPFLRRSVSPSWLSRDQADIRMPAGRRRWVAMLLLAMIQGFGRAGHHGEQRRGFLEECERRDWIDRFAAPTDDAKWIAFIDDFVRDRLGHIPHFHAFRSSFVGARVLVRWLEEHLEVFRQMGNRTETFNLLQAFRPGSDPYLSGSGISPPPLPQVLGSVGASFLLREMVRGGFLANTACIIPHCYPPTTAVRRLLAEMGCPGMGDRDDRWGQSRLIHHFLSDNLADPTFGGDYDIPLWVFASERPEYASTEDDEP